MVKRKVCKRCKLFIDGSECPRCKTSSFSTSWHGRLQFLNVKESTIAEKMNMKENGEYAIKVK